MASIFELVTATELAAYWNTGAQNRVPYLGQELWDDQQKLGLGLKWIKGAMGLPVVLAPSAYDVKAKNRQRIGFDKLTSEIPFFKESTSIDESLRQELNMVIETGNQVYIDAVLNRVFADEMYLLEGAAAQRERMRMMALTTGAIAISANGQDYNIDYLVPAEHKDTVSVSWSNPASDIMGDIRTWQDKIQDDTGVRPSRAVCSRKTWGYFKLNTAIKNSIFVLSNGQAVISDNRLISYLSEELGLEVVVYTKSYKDEAGNKQAYVADDIFVMFPEGKLGTGWFGTTPEQSDLMSGTAANVVIVDTGVAITTMKNDDPVTVTTKVTMAYLPSFEAADQIFIADLTA